MQGNAFSINNSLRFSIYDSLPKSTFPFMMMSVYHKDWEDGFLDLGMEGMGFIINNWGKGFVIKQLIGMGFLMLNEEGRQWVS